MKNPVFNQLQALSNNDINTINGGTNGEDYISPEQKLFIEIMTGLQSLISVI